MNDLHASVATTLDSALPSDEPVVARAPGPGEFGGSSDHTIAEAVRRALSRASISLRT
jgi:hypothetical protein